MMKFKANAWGLVGFVGLLCAASAMAQSSGADASHREALSAASAQRAAQRAAVAQERKHNLERRKQAEVQCYRLFAVEDCLRDARNDWRLVESRLRTQEVEIHDQERKEKAKERLRQIEEKQTSAAKAHADSDAGSGTDATSSRPPSHAARPAGREKTSGEIVLRDRQAQERALAQRERQATQPADQIAREKESAERAAKARQRQVDAEKASEARRARRDREQAQSAAGGHKPSASLPTPAQ